MAEWLRAPAALPKDTGCSPKGSWVAGKLFLWSLWTWAYTPPPTRMQTQYYLHLDSQ